MRRRFNHDGIGRQDPENNHTRSGRKAGSLDLEAQAFDQWTWASSCSCVACAAALLAGCVSAKKYDSLEAQYQQFDQSLPSDVAAKQVTITRLQGAIKVTINSELLFPSGGWQMPAAAQQTIAKMAPILAPQIQNRIMVSGYTSNTPIGPELARQGITSNLVLSDKRANTVAQYLVSQGVSAPPTLGGM
jgi:chemotaxis protein MotB